VVPPVYVPGLADKSVLGAAEVDGVVVPWCVREDAGAAGALPGVVAALDAVLQPVERRPSLPVFEAAVKGLLEEVEAGARSAPPHATPTRVGVAGDAGAAGTVSHGVLCVHCVHCVVCVCVCVCVCVLFARALSSWIPRAVGVDWWLPYVLMLVVSDGFAWWCQQDMMDTCFYGFCHPEMLCLPPFPPPPLPPPPHHPMSPLGQPMRSVCPTSMRRPSWGPWQLWASRSTWTLWRTVCWTRGATA
jgi:hypothetical protein